MEVAIASSATGESPPLSIMNGEIALIGETKRLPGDVDGDGRLTARDAMSVLRMSVGKQAPNPAADMDEDGKITSRDATMILLAVVAR